MFMEQCCVNQAGISDAAAAPQLVLLALGIPTTLPSTHNAAPSGNQPGLGFARHRTHTERRRSAYPMLQDRDENMTHHPWRRSMRARLTQASDTVCRIRFLLGSLRAPLWRVAASSQGGYTLDQRKPSRGPRRHLGGHYFNYRATSKYHTKGSTPRVVFVML